MSSSFLLSPGGSNATASSQKRQLIRPTTHIPWSVDVVSAVPGPVSEILDTALSGATHNKWACLAFPKGIIYVWQIQQTSNLGETLQRPKEYVRFVFPDMQLGERDIGRSDTAPLLALCSPHGEDRDSVHLYALNPQTGWLVLRKISRRDMQSTVPMTHSARVRIPMAVGTGDNSGGEDEDMGREEEPVFFEALTCL